MFCVGKLSHADGTLSAVELVQELILHLPQLLMDLGSRSVYQSKVISFSVRMNYLTIKVIVYADIVACLNEMYNMLFQVALSIKLLEL